MSDYQLGRKIEPDKPAPGPEWVPHPTNKQLRVNTRTGQMKTYIPANEVASPPYGWPNYSPPFPPIEEAP